MKRFTLVLALLLNIAILFILFLAIPSHAQTTYTARTDVTAQAYPSPIPCPFTPGTCTSSGGTGTGSLTGAGYCFTPSDFATQICRITDVNFYPGAASTNQHNFQTDVGGSAESNIMDLSDTRFYVSDTGSAINIGKFDGTTNPPTFSILYNSLLAGCSSGQALTENLYFSYTQAKVAYAESFTATGSPNICQYDFTSTTTAPTVANGKITQLVDLSTCVAALSGVGSTVALDDVTVSADDQTFAALGSTTSGQGSSGAHYVVIWNRTNGCRSLDTSTTIVTGAWGTTGSLSQSDEYLIHNLRLGKSGTWVAITPASCLNAACSAHQVSTYKWNIPNLNVYLNVNDGGSSGGGHRTLGYNNIVNFTDTGFCHMTGYIRPNTSDDTSGSQLNLNCPSPVSQNDMHWGWTNGNTSDNNPVIGAVWLGLFAVTNAWDNEILGFPTSAPGTLPVYRFAHTYNTSLNAWSFNAQESVGTISQDGKYYFWTSDWDGMLGNTDGVTTACTIASNCRPDVFMLILPTVTSVVGTVIAPKVSIGVKVKVQ